LGNIVIDGGIILERKLRKQEQRYGLVSHNLAQGPLKLSTLYIDECYFVNMFLLSGCCDLAHSFV
jgi:hypothetical protein